MMVPYYTQLPDTFQALTPNPVGFSGMPNLVRAVRIITALIPLVFTLCLPSRPTFPPTTITAALLQERASP